MCVGVIGVGRIGGTLARNLRALGWTLRVANSREQEGVRAFANTIGAEASDLPDGDALADAVILSIPFFAIEMLPSHLFADLPESVPVINTTNYYPYRRIRASATSTRAWSRASRSKTSSDAAS